MILASATDHSTQLAWAEALATVADRRDGGREALRVGTVAETIGARLGLGADESRALALAGRLHDVGKVAIPDAILNKPGPLTDREVRIARSHAAVGAELVAGLPGLEEVAEAIAASHERMDGAGYPHGLVGDAIPLVARILFVADAYDAMTSARPWRPAFTDADAREELRHGAGRLYDAAVVRALLA